MEHAVFWKRLRPELFPSPCFVTDTAALRRNAAILDQVQERTGAKILLALKAFSQWRTFPHLSRAFHGPLYGCCASSPDEARMAREDFGGEVHAFAAAWSREDMLEVLRHADHVVFNSFSQWRSLRPLLAQNPERRARPVQCGLRLNPEHSESAPALYDPCAPGSRLGVCAREMNEEMERDPGALRGLCGLHFHTLCEQDAGALARTLDALEEKFRPALAGMGKDLRWINFGGGHPITRPGYDLDLLCRCIERVRDACRVQIYLEPGEAVALNAGVLLCTVLDVVRADLPVAVLDVSVACHLPDVLEMPYRPGVMGAGLPGEKAWTCRLGGKSCLAGDTAGEYSFDAPLHPGDRLVFLDMAIYSMVKTSTFNGLRLPSIAVWDSETDAMEVTRTFGYEDFRGRL